MGMFMVRAKPAWRDWAYGWRAERSWERTREETAWTIDQLIATVDLDVGRWNALLSFWDSVSIQQYHRLLDECLSVTEKHSWSDEELKELWESLNRIVVRLNFIVSRSSPRKDDPPERLTNASEGKQVQDRYAKRFSEFHSRLIELRNKLIPKDWVLASVHAFCYGLGEKHLSNHFDDRLEHERRKLTIEKVQQRFIRELFTSEGLDGVLRLAEHPEANAEVVGLVSAQTVFSEDIDVERIISFLGQDLSDRALLAKGVIRGLRVGQSEDSSDQLLGLLGRCKTEHQKAGFLLALPVGPPTWDLVDAQAEQVIQQYWEQTRLPFDTPEDQMPRLVHQLIENGRSADAADQLGHYVQQDGKCSQDVILETMEGLLAENDDRRGVSSRQSLRWELQQLFSRLYDGEPGSLDELNRLVRLELAYSKLFHNDEARGLQPHGFVRLLSDSPSAFIEAVAFFSRDDEGNFRHDTDTDSAKYFGKQTYSILESLTTLPGLGEEKAISLAGCQLEAWTALVVEVAHKEKFTRATCQQLAKILTRGSFQLGSAWPADHVAEAINLIDSDETRDALRLGLYNDRGVHCVDHSGQANFEAAVDRRARAEEIEVTSPGAAHALREYAAILEREAKRLIEEARWGRD